MATRLRRPKVRRPRLQRPSRSLTRTNQHRATALRPTVKARDDGVGDAAVAVRRASTAPDDPTDTVLRVREPRPANTGVVGHRWVDPHGGQATATARRSRSRPAAYAGAERGRVPRPAGIRSAQDDHQAAGKSCSDRGTGGRHPGRALRRPSLRRLLDRQRLPRSGAERASLDGSGFRRHRPEVATA